MISTDPEIEIDPVLSAYWLAHHYHQHPDTFLALSSTEIFEHVAATHRVLKAIAEAQKDA